MIFATSAFIRTLSAKPLVALALALGCVAGAPGRANAEAMLLIEADTGRVLHAENATAPWYPASVTKVMTAYVTLKAVKAGRLSLNTLLTVSPIAAAQAPSKMGFKVGSQITVDNALKSLMVKSANDMAVTLAEGVSGSVEAFADEMNRAAARLGMTQTTYVNPNGLPAEEQITSARDQAILAQAVYRELPEYEFYWRVSAIKFGKRVMRNTNTLLDRYQGTDGLKTGFICASGFNVVVTATRNNRRLIAVVFGARSGPVRAVKAAQMLERGFQTGSINWLQPSMGTVQGLKAVNTPPPDMRDEICGKKRKRPPAESEDMGEDEQAQAALPPGVDPNSPQALMLSNLRNANSKPSALIGPLTPSMEPVEIWLGATKGSVPAATASSKKSKPKKDATASKDGAAPTPAQKPNTSPAAAPAFAATPSSPPAGKFTPSAAPASGASAQPTPKPKPEQAATPAAKKQPAKSDAKSASKPDNASKKSDAKTSDAKKPDTKASSAKKTDTKKTDAKKSDAKKPDTKKPADIATKPQAAKQQ